MIAGRALMLLIGLLAYGSHAHAQATTPEFRARHFIFSVGVTGETGYPIGDINAQLRRNASGTPSPLALFRAESQIEGVAAVDARVAVALTRTVSLEVGGMFAQPQLRSRITGDVEAPEQTFADERLSQYAVNVSGTFLVPRVNIGSRVRTYLIGGAGYLRQLHEGRLRVDTGRTVHLGGGVQYWFRGGANRRQHPVGIRGEARYVRRTGGVDYEGRARNFPAMSALLFLGL